MTTGMFEVLENDCAQSVYHCVQCTAPVKYLRPCKRRRRTHLSLEQRRTKRGRNSAPATVTEAITQNDNPRHGSPATLRGVDQNQVTRIDEPLPQPPPQPPPQLPPRPAQRRTYNGTNGRNSASTCRVVGVISVHDEDEHLGRLMEVNNARSETGVNIRSATSKIILLEFKPLKRPEPAVISLYVVNNTVVKKCTNCKQNTPNVCAMCRRMSYCTVYCQEKDWTSHEPNCTLTLEPTLRYSIVVVRPRE